MTIQGITKNRMQKPTLQWLDLKAVQHKSKTYFLGLSAFQVKTNL